jgi:hypothetical protein
MVSEIRIGEDVLAESLEGLFESQINRLVSLNECPVEVKDDPTNSFLEVVEDLLKTIEKVAGYVFVDTISVERVFSEHKIGFFGPTAIRKSISNIEDRLILGAMGLNQSLLARPAAATPFMPVRIGKGFVSSRTKGSDIGMEGDLGETMEV